MKTFESQPETSLKAMLDRLHRLQQFDPKAFSADAKASQEVCDFILALALIYNDCKDSVYAWVLLTGFIHGQQPEISPQRGTVNGLIEHAVRYQMGILHELLKLIEKHRDTLEDPTFKNVVKQLTGPSKDAWNTLAAIADGKSSNSEVAHVLLLVRNKVGSHYDPKAIGIAYRSRFLGPSPADAPMVSRGRNMQESRFYFADAIAQEYVQVATRQCKDSVTRDQIARTVDLLNHAIVQIVDRFLTFRGYGFRDVRG